MTYRDLVIQWYDSAHKPIDLNAILAIVEKVGKLAYDHGCLSHSNADNNYFVLSEDEYKEELHNKENEERVNNDEWVRGWNAGYDAGYSAGFEAGLPEV